MYSITVNIHGYHGHYERAVLHRGGARVDTLGEQRGFAPKKRSGRECWQHAENRPRTRHPLCYSEQDREPSAPLSSCLSHPTTDSETSCCRAMYTGNIHGGCEERAASANTSACAFRWRGLAAGAAGPVPWPASIFRILKVVRILWPANSALKVLVSGISRH
jgi:hypothetical protein